MSHAAALLALNHAATRGAMKSLSGKLKDVRAARLRTKVGTLDRTLIVVESQELLEGQKRGINQRLAKAKKELAALDARVAKGNITRSRLETRLKEVLRREYLASFVVVSVGGDEHAPTFQWKVDAKLRARLEATRLGKRVLCTDRHLWSTGRIVDAFRGQWKVEELFRRAKGGGITPWGPSFQHADASIRLHTFATVLGLTLVSLAHLVVGEGLSAKRMMEDLSGIKATIVRCPREGRGRPQTVPIAPTVTAWQRRAIDVFELERWMPQLASCRPARSSTPKKPAAA